MQRDLVRQATQESEVTRWDLPPRPSANEERELSVTVVFTSVRATLGALKQAGIWAARLGARITLIVPQTVPYPLTLTAPPVSRDFNERRFRVLAEESRVETIVHILLGRDSDETVLGALKPHSLVVLGEYKRWLPSQEKRLARRLRRAGHEVILAGNGVRSQIDERVRLFRRGDKTGIPADNN